MKSAQPANRITSLAIGLALMAVVSCGPSAPPIIALPPEQPQDVLVWAFDEDGEISTFWLKGDSRGGVIVASRPGLVLSSVNGAWELRWEEVELTLCDCDTWMENGQDGQCPAAQAVSVAQVPVLINLVTEERLEPVEFPADDPDNGPTDVERTPHFSLIFSVGPYLFFRFGEHNMSCGAAHENWFEEFIIFDLDSGERTDLLNEQERQLLLQNEQAAAFDQVRTDNHVDVETAQDLELTFIEPMLLPGVGLTFRYQFSAHSSFAHSDGAWSSYTRSVAVPVQNLPESLAPHVALPPALMAFAMADDTMQIGGWLPVSGNEDQLAVLATVFLEE